MSSGDVNYNIILFQESDISQAHVEKPCIKELAEQPCPCCPKLSPRNLRTSPTGLSSTIPALSLDKPRSLREKVCLKPNKQHSLLHGISDRGSPACSVEDSPRGPKTSLFTTQPLLTCPHSAPGRTAQPPLLVETSPSLCAAVSLKSPCSLLATLADTSHSKGFLFGRLRFLAWTASQNPES